MSRLFVTAAVSALSIWVGARARAQSPSPTFDKVTITSTGSSGDVSQMSALTFGNLFTRPTYGGGGAAASFSSLLNSIYALSNTNDSNTSYPASGIQYPFPIFSHTPVTSEASTHSALFDHIVDNPNEDRRVFAHSLTYEATTGGNKAVGDFSGERVNTYLGVRGYPGAGSIWAVNSQTHLYPGYNGPGATGYEVDVTNQAQHRGDGFGQVAYLANNSTGITLNSLSTYRNASGIILDGKLTDGTPAWNRGYVVYNGAVNASWGCSFCDYGGAYATLQSFGSHTVTIDLTNTVSNYAAIGLPAGADSRSAISWFSGGAPVATLSSDLVGNGLFTGASFQATGSIKASALNITGSGVISNGNFNDPAQNVAYDLKLGGSGNGLAVNGPSLFKGVVTYQNVPTQPTAGSYGAACFDAGGRLFVAPNGVCPHS